MSKDGMEERCGLGIGSRCGKERPVLRSTPPAVYVANTTSLLSSRFQCCQRPCYDSAQTIPASSLWLLTAEMCRHCAYPETLISIRTPLISPEYEHQPCGSRLCAVCGPTPRTYSATMGSRNLFRHQRSCNVMTTRDANRYLSPQRGSVYYQKSGHGVHVELDWRIASRTLHTLLAAPGIFTVRVSIK
ncbi:hypothetical protein M011DRAFT_72137 [Sporormia fimetaria CBS 119925]|uniref:Uncharacterized protein n=1 Tax=Sporormia fimetaria CBS 119925 TaxID=1340428 RepID=A0A6A6V8U3_9PLEO|nr:hypothetical protein M011DRAFT_72137 [Sporormia fimetaria CBS 119925]